MGPSGTQWREALDVMRMASRMDVTLPLSSQLLALQAGLRAGAGWAPAAELMALRAEDATSRRTPLQHERYTVCCTPLLCH